MYKDFENYLKNKALIKSEDVPKILALVSQKQLKKHDFLLTKGQVCQHGFFIEKGLLRMYSMDEAGKEHILQFAPENWFISDRSSIYFEHPSEYFIDAIEDSSVIQFDKTFTEKASLISPEFRNYNEYLLQKHIGQLQSRINLLIGASAEKRYLDFIALYPELVMRIPQWMIASYLGITPEGLSRVRKSISKTS